MEYIDIFYIATGVYASYFSDMISSVHNFFPNYKKRIHIISDVLQEASGYTDYGIESIDVYYQLDLPYPIIPLLKTHFIKNLVTDDMKYIFYCDADTIFLEKPQEYWDTLIATMDAGDILAARHPANYYPPYGIDENSGAFIKMGTPYYPIISSFYGGPTYSIIRLCNEMGKMIKSDLTYQTNGHQGHYIPPLFDQDYFTVAVQKSRDIGLSFTVLPFVHIEWLENAENEKQFECVNQKYDIKRKFETKNIK